MPLRFDPTSLFAVWITTRAQRRSEKRKDEQARKQTFLVLDTELRLHKKMLSALETSLGSDKTFVNPRIDSYSVTHFLESNYVDITKDSDLISKLHEHLQNISTLNSALGIVDMVASGWTTVHSATQKSVEAGMKKSLVGVIKELDGCLEEIASKNIL